MGSQQGDDLQLNGDLACENAEIRGELIVAGSPITPGTVADGNYGDITVSVGGSVWTINNGVVTLAKMANLAGASIIGRVAGAAGVPQALTGAQAAQIVGGTLLNRQVFTASGTYTPTPGTNRVVVEVWGSGGGGGGSTGSAVAGQLGAGGGGGTGTVTTFFIAPGAAITGGAVTIGAGGAGGAAGANNGDPGNPSSVVIQGVARLSPGGIGGSGGAAAAVGCLALGGGTVGVGGGNQGGAGIAIASLASINGYGASSPWGRGGQPVRRTPGQAGLTGNNGSGNASGGAGASGTDDNTARAGGNGTDGIIIIDEYS